MEQQQKHFWSQETLDWYSRATAHGDYHARLAAFLAPWLSGGSVCDLGCGTGALSLALLQHIPAVTAIDQDPGALALLREQAKSVPGLQVLEADAMALPTASVWDHLLLSFFGRITVEDHLDYFLSHCRRQLICIVNGGPKSSFSSTGSSAKHKEYVPQVARFLDSRGLSYHLECHTLEFGQPLHDLEDARAFVRRYSPPGCRELQDEALMERLLPCPEGGYYLPSQMNLGIFVIEKGGAL